MEKHLKNLPHAAIYLVAKFLSLGII